MAGKLDLKMLKLPNADIVVFCMGDESEELLVVGLSKAKLR